jgi:ankyrin repeat protein
VDTYSAELLFEMAVAKAVDFNPTNGIDYEGILKLVGKASTAKIPSLAGAGVVAQLFSALASTTHPPPALTQEDLLIALHRAVGSGSISTRPILEAMDPQSLHEAMSEFRITGGYNQERYLFLQEHPNLEAILLAEQDDATVVRMLSSHQVMRNTRNTYLHVAAMVGKHELVQMLVKEPGVEIDSLNAAGETPLYKACLAGQYKSVKVLIDNGADPFIRVSHLKISCLHWLFAFPRDEMEDVASLFISKGFNIQARVNHASEGNPNAYKWATSMHFPFYWPAGTPLHWAAHAESTDAVDVLLKFGAAIDEPDFLENVGAQTALSMAMYRGSISMVSHLLEKDANAARIDGGGCSQLHIVVGDRLLHNTLFPLAKHFMQWCYHGSFENTLASARFCVAAIINAGISIDYQRPMGRTSTRLTPLLDAVHKKDAAGVIALLESGANADVVEDYTGKLPLHIWAETDPRSLAYPDAYLRTLHALFKSTTNPAQRDSGGQSIFHMAMVGADAVSNSDLEIWRQKLNMLLQYCSGLGIDDRDDQGMTLLLHITDYDARHGWNVLPVIEILQNDFGAGNPR